MQRLGGLPDKRNSGRREVSAAAAGDLLLVRVPRAAVVAAESRIAAQISVMTAIGADRLAARDGR